MVGAWEPGVGGLPRSADGFTQTSRSTKHNTLIQYKSSVMMSATDEKIFINNFFQALTNILNFSPDNAFGVLRPLVKQIFDNWGQNHKDPSTKE